MRTLKSPMITWRIIQLDHTHSTMDVVHKHAQRGEPQGLVVYASTQDKGRGRLARPWESPPGGLYVSVLLRPDDPFCYVPTYAQIGLSSTLAALYSICGAELRGKLKIKPPNDIVLRGKKCAGILCEVRSDIHSSAPYLVIGLGINVNTPQKLLPPCGISISTFLKTEYDIDTLLDTFLVDLAQSLSALRNTQGTDK